MLGVFTAPDAAVFSAALLLMLAIGLVEAIGLGASGMDAHLGLDVDQQGILGWLGFGRVPFLVMLVAFLASFGIIGLTAQHIAMILRGHLLHSLIVVPSVAITSLPITALLGRGLARILPHDETTAYERDDLVGRFGTLVLGSAQAGSPARIRVVDPHGQAHHVMVEPDDDASIFREGDTVLLVRREGDHFRAILHEQPHYSNWTLT